MNHTPNQSQHGTNVNFYELGQRLHEMGAFAAAVRALEIAAMRSENAAKAYSLLGECYTALEMPESAKQALMVAKRLGRQAPTTDASTASNPT